MKKQWRRGLFVLTLIVIASALCVTGAMAREALPKTKLTEDMFKLTGLAPVFDGSAKQAGVSSDLAAEDYNVSIRYSPAAPVINAGYYDVIATITASDAGAYEGSVILKDTMQVKPDETPLKVDLSQSVLYFDGEEKRPAISSVTRDGAPLMAGNEYDVTWPEESAQIGKKTVTVTGRGNYGGKGTAVYSILPKLEASLAVKEYVYDGTEKKPALASATYEGKPLDAGNYSLTWPADCAGIGKKTVTLVCQGDYEGSVSMTYEIKPCVITDENVKLSFAETVYNGAVQKPAVTVTYPGTGDVDCVITVPESQDAGVYTVEVACRGNFSGTVTKKYEIKKYALAQSDVRMAIIDMVYNGAVQKPTVLVTYPGAGDVDCVITVPESQDAGVYTASVVCQGNFTGAFAKSYEIRKYWLEDDDVQIGFENAYFNDDVQKPSVTVTYPGAGDVDCVITVPDSKQAGLYTVDVTAKGNFAGSVTKEYAIRYLPTPANPVTLVGRKGNNDWYFAETVKVMPAAGYKIAKNAQLGTAGAAYLAFGDGEHIGQTCRLVNDRGEFTDVIEIPSYKQDTKAPAFEVKMSRGRVNVSAKAQDDTSGAIIAFYKYDEEKDSVAAPADNVGQEITLKKTIVQPGAYTLVICDAAGNYAFAQETYSFYYGDADNDGLCDAYEWSWGSDSGKTDTDGDGLGDYTEYCIGTSPTSQDTDGDGLTDAEEKDVYKTSPLKADSDADGIEDFVSVLLERYYGRSPKAPTAMNIALGNKLLKADARVDKASLPGALAKLEDNGYLREVTPDPFVKQSKRVVARGDAQVRFSKGNEIHMVKADAALHRVYGVHTPTGLLVTFDVDAKGGLEVVDAINLNELFGTEALSGVSVVSDDNASILVIGNWNEAEGKADSDLAVFVPGAGSVWLIADTAGVARFDVSPDASKIAFSMGGEAATASVLDLVTGNPLGMYQAPCDTLFFTRDSKLVTALNENTATVYTVDEETITLTEGSEAFYGVYPLKQSTINGQALRLLGAPGDSPLMPDGVQMDVNAAGYATARSTLISLGYMADGMRNSAAYPDYFNAD